MLLPFTYLAFPYFLSLFQAFDGPSDTRSDRRPVLPHRRQRRRKTRCRNRPPPILGLQEPPFVEYRLPAGLDQRVLQQGIEQHGHMPQVVHPYTKALLAGKESFHILRMHRNTKQTVSIGTRHNTCHLFTAEVTAQREWRFAYRLLRAPPVGPRQRSGRVIHPFQLHTLIERERVCCKKRFDKVGTVCQQALYDVDIHFVAVPAGRLLAVYVPVAVHPVLHVAVIPLPVPYYLL